MKKLKTFVESEKHDSLFSTKLSQM